MKTEINYIIGNEELLDRVKDLWTELNQLHAEKSIYNKKYYANNTFEARKKALLSTSRNGQLCIVLAHDETALVGYCIASIVAETGEIDSIFVTKSYRKKGIAGNMMNQALDWLKRRNPNKTVIKVSVGNEEVYGFYAKFGFYPYLTELQKISE